MTPQASRIEELQCSSGRETAGREAVLVQPGALRASEVCTACRSYIRLPQPCSGPPEVELRGDRAHRGKVDLERLGGALQLDLTATVRAARRERYIDLPVRSADGSHAADVATTNVAAATSRPCRLRLASPLENGAAWRLPERRHSPSRLIWLKAQRKEYGEAPVIPIDYPATTPPAASTPSSSQRCDRERERARR
jgi:hypothetical protein